MHRFGTEVGCQDVILAEADGLQHLSVAKAKCASLPMHAHSVKQLEQNFCTPKKSDGFFFVGVTFKPIKKCRSH